MTEVKRRETQWAIMEPNVYAGPRCDEVRARWKCWASGEDADHQSTPLLLAARTFPPGTKVTIAEPLCPTCGEHRPLIWPTPKRGSLYASKCKCGFDWDAWVLEQYS